MLEKGVCGATAMEWRVCERLFGFAVCEERLRVSVRNELRVYETKQKNIDFPRGRVYNNGIMLFVYRFCDFGGCYGSVG